jgi:translation elongation factor P/translation initiation factor 5A
MVVAVGDAREGTLVIGEDGDLYRIEGRRMCPPCTTWRPMYDFLLRHLGNGRTRQVRYSDESVFEAAELPERELEYLYSVDTGLVFLDPKSGADYCVPRWVVGDVPGSLMFNQRLFASFWRGQPVKFRSSSEDAASETGVAPDRGRPM